MGTDFDTLKLHDSAKD